MNCPECGKIIADARHAVQAHYKKKHPDAELPMPKKVLKQKDNEFDSYTKQRASEFKDYKAMKNSGKDGEIVSRGDRRALVISGANIKTRY